MHVGVVDRLSTAWVEWPPSLRPGVRSSAARMAPRAAHHLLELDRQAVPPARSASVEPPARARFAPQVQDFIFNFSDGDRTDAATLLRAKMWGVGRDERHRGALAAGDPVLTHVAHPGGGFIGRAVLATPVHDRAPLEAEAYPCGEAGGVLLSAAFGSPLTDTRPWCSSAAKLWNPGRARRARVSDAAWNCTGGRAEVAQVDSAASLHPGGSRGEHGERRGGDT
jgi:hypothetical protein